MKQSALTKITLTTWLLAAIVVADILITQPPNLENLPIALLFGLLIILSDTFSIPAGGGYISLMPMLVMTTFLVLGLPYTSLLVLLASVVHALVRWFGSARLGLPRLANKYELLYVVTANGTMLTISIVISGLIFVRWFGVALPLTEVPRRLIIPLTIFILSYFAVNYAIAAAFLRLRSPDAYKEYVAGLSNALLYELTAMPFAPLVALIYTRIGYGYFVMFALALIMASLVMHNLEQMKQGLERRLRELSSLQAIGQTLSASLEVDKVLTAVYQQVSSLMPAKIFFVALLDAATEEVSFPLAVQEERPLNWEPRPLGNGLTDYIIRTRQPLLIGKNMPQALERLQVDLLGSLSQSWLGVPLIAGDQILGVISVQSEMENNVFDASHLEVLTTIAAQAAVAIQNARLYTQTDKALARRVQELDSILATTREGVLLLDSRWCVLTANRAFLNMVNMPGAQLNGRHLTTWPEVENPLITQIGYTAADLENDLNTLLTKQAPRLQKQITLPNNFERYFERELAPVYGLDTPTAGWLLVFREVTEEVELEQLRQEMTHMLVHDLRSPLSIMKGSIDVLKGELESLDMPLVDELMEYMDASGDRLLKLVGDVLDIHQFESGIVPLHHAPIEVAHLFNDIVVQFAPTLEEMQITLAVDIQSELPHLYVDSSYIGRVLANLVDNAIKYTEDNGRIRLWAKMAEQEMMLVGVDDTGSGVPPAVQPQMFQKFHKDLSGKGRRKGSGLGLAFCKLVVEAHGGQIWLESSGVPGEGSCFVMRLPICDHSQA